MPVDGSSNGNSAAVNTGNVGVICPQSSPGWGQIADKFFPDYLAGIPFNLTATEEANAAAASTTPVPPPDPRITEDCLFLDVLVPQKVFHSKGGTGAPVMVWFSGGYTFGDKAQFDKTNPAGLIEAGNDEFVYVSFNYRVSHVSFPLVFFHWQPDLG